jgi:signal transduction histidine kinase
MNLHLLIHNILYGFDILLTAFLIVLILFKSKRDTASIMLVCVFLCVIVFVTSHILGVSVQSGELSRMILMFNLTGTFMPVFTLHSVLAMFGQQKRYKNILIAIYGTAVVIVAFFIINPFLFLQTSIPKLYFPNYYVAGAYYWVMLAFFFAVLICMFVQLSVIYRMSNGLDKKRAIYFAIAAFFGYSIGSVDFFLIYNIPVDPLWGIFFIPIFSIPFTYAVVQYELMDIKLVAKKAFVYATITVVLGFILIGFNYLNALIAQAIPGFPVWISSIILALATTALGFFIWNKIREADILKYEFVTIVTHKFRTPLTYIKWSSDNIAKAVPADLAEDVKNIQAANGRLFELTNILAHLSDADDSSSGYRFENLDLNKMLREIVDGSMQEAQSKKINLSYTPTPADPALADDQRIRFVFQTLVDNAVTYTPDGGKVTVTLLQSGAKIIVNISDTGIGIGKNEEKYIFNKFYRTPRATKTDTEGMGIGLFLAREIMKRHNGGITVESEGEDKGASFTVTLPAVKP